MPSPVARTQSGDNPQHEEKSPSEPGEEMGRAKRAELEWFVL